MKHMKVGKPEGTARRAAAETAETNQNTMSGAFNASIVEDVALGCFGGPGYAVGHGPHLALGDRRRDGSHAMWV